MTGFGDEDLNTVLRGSIPKHEDLRCLIGTINFSDKNTSNISNKAYQCQIFKCRCLIFSVPEVIASPVLGAVQNIHIVVSRDYYLSGKLSVYLDRMNIKVEEPIPLSNTIYESCLRYTVLARLAPSWNQVERYLVKGRDFLLNPAPLDAAKLDIVINESDMHIVLWPLRLRLPQVCPQDYQTPPRSWHLPSSPAQAHVHVLPSLNQANVLMVTKQIPHNSLFQSYKDLKRHWKNSYGYRLPDSEEGMLYLTVKFGCWFSESLTYPAVCVRARRPVFLRQLRPQQVLLELLADLHARLPQVCGHPFAVDTNLCYAVPKLSSATTICPAMFSCNLSNTKPDKLKRDPIDIDDDDDVLIIEDGSASHPSQPVSQYTQTQTTQIRRGASQKRNVSPPPFLPRLTEKVAPSPPPKPLFYPIFTPKTKGGSKTSAPASSPSPWLAASPSSPTKVPTKPLFGGAVAQTMFGGTPIKPVFGLAQSFHTSDKKGVGQIPSHPFNPNRGEKTLLHLPESVGLKKVRNKPQVQTGVDVKALAHTRGGLDKVNTTTLIAYLRSEGVPCKVKDKKAELVAKVLNHLNLPSHAIPRCHVTSSVCDSNT